MRILGLGLAISVALLACASHRGSEPSSSDVTAGVGEPSDAPAIPTTSSTPVEEVAADIFAEYEYWIAADLNGEPIYGGPSIVSSRVDRSVSVPDADGTIGGCVLGSQYPFVTDAVSLTVDESIALVSYDCGAPRMDLASAQMVRELVFEDPDYVLETRILELHNHGNVLTFRPRATYAELVGTWMIVAISGAEATEVLSLEFEDPSDDLPVAEMLMCGQPIGRYRYSRFDLIQEMNRGSDEPCSEPLLLVVEERAVVEDSFSRGSQIRLISPGRLELFDGDLLIELRRADGLS